MSNITMGLARVRYTEGNNKGHGFAPPSAEPGDDTIASAVQAAAADGWTLVLSRETSDDVAVLERDSKLMAIGGDAQGHGAWAVMIRNVAP